MSSCKYTGSLGVFPGLLIGLLQGPLSTSSVSVKILLVGDDTGTRKGSEVTLSIPLTTSLWLTWDEGIFLPSWIT